MYKLKLCFSSCWTWEKKKINLQCVFLAKGVQPHLPTMTDITTKTLPSQCKPQDQHYPHRKATETAVKQASTTNRGLHCHKMAHCKLKVRINVRQVIWHAAFREFTNPALVAWGEINVQCIEEITSSVKSHKDRAFKCVWLFVSRSKASLH